MTMTVTIPDGLAHQVQERARLWRRPPEDIVLDILRSAFTEPPIADVDEVVARIKSAPPNPHNIRKPHGALADVLRRESEDDDFDLDMWNREWAAVEAEIQAINRANDLAESR